MRQNTWWFFKKYWPVFSGFFLLQILFEQARSWSYFATGKTSQVFWSASIINSTTDYFLWAFITILLYQVYKWWRTKPSLARSMLFLGIIVLISTAQALMSQALYLLVYEVIVGYKDPFEEVFSRNIVFFVPAIFIGSVVAFFLLSLIAALDFYEKFKEEQLLRAELAGELSRSKVEALQAQLNPHFLFNAMNTISMMVRKAKNNEAVSMISSLSDMLRMTLKLKDTHLISLNEEMRIVTKYLELEQERFNDRLTINIQVQREAERCQVPNMILQPIIENAFKYGVTENLDEATINIEAIETGNRLILSVMNNGNMLQPEWELERHSGIGLSNVKKRLSYLFDEYGFRVFNDLERGLVVAEISIPCKPVLT